MQSRKGSRRDPFANHINFPCFDDAFRSINDNDERCIDQSSEAVDQSICSQASLLNLSIGARAALNEHLRHVAKYGLDDSREVAQDFGLEGENSLRTQRDPRDVLWEKLVDSSNISFNSVTNSAHLSLENLRYFDQVLTLPSDDGHEEVETLADQSSDYFNSSRVMLLQTPDRIRSTKMNAVTSRTGGSTFDESFACSEECEPSSVARLFHASRAQFNSTDVARPMMAELPNFDSTTTDNSFSLSAVDLSRISADGSEDLCPKRSPDTSFVSQDHRTTIDDSRYGAIEPLTSPTYRSYGESTPQRKPDHKSFWPSHRKSPPRRQYIKENVLNHSEKLGLSPAGSRSQGSGSKKKPPLTTSKLVVPESQRQRSVPVGSSIRLPAHDSRISSMIVEYGGPVRAEGCDSDLSTLQNSSSEKNSNVRKESPLSSSDASQINTPSLDLDDRRRYRTVVPTRVFLTEPPDEFPEQYDSFSAPPPVSRRRTINTRLVQSSMW